MKNSRIQVVFAVVALVLAGAAEELAPKLLEVGFPFLLALVQHFAAKRPLPRAAVFAAAAGAMEDALSGLPPMTSASWFVIVALVVGRIGLPRAVAALSYPLYQVWILAWTSAPGGGIFVRILMALPIGLATAFATSALLAWCERKAALDEED